MSPLDTSSPKILLLDDDEIILLAIKETLGREGYDISVFSRAGEALEALKSDHFAVIVSDQRMPEMTGLEFCREMRSTGIRPDVPVVLLTAKSMELDADLLRDELGVIAVLGKPFSPSLLVKTAQRLCEDAAMMA